MHQAQGKGNGAESVWSLSASNVSVNLNCSRWHCSRISHNIYINCHLPTKRCTLKCCFSTRECQAKDAHRSLRTFRFCIGIPFLGWNGFECVLTKRDQFCWPHLASYHVIHRPVTHTNTFILTCIHFYVTQSVLYGMHGCHWHLSITRWIRLWPFCAKKNYINWRNVDAATN